MNWRAKLQEQRSVIFQKGEGDSLTKPTQPGFVGSVSDPPGHSENIVVPRAGALRAERARLLALADRLGIDPAHVHRMTDADLVLWGLVPADALRSYLLALDDAATRQAGKVPLDDTAVMYCRHCGPVWTHPDIAAVLPVVDGWPRALGCPWCAVRKAGGYIPRPKVACEDCQDFTPDTINPPVGMGTCAKGNGTYYPMTKHRCASFQPEKEPIT